MLIKRFTLMGAILVSTGWISRTQADGFDGGKKMASPTVIAHTTAAGSESQNDFNELFVAVTLGSSNGARLNPKAFTFVQDYMKENWDELQEIKSSGKNSFGVIEGILAQYGLPKELEYLAVIESNLKASAVSPVGAVGPWQLMPQTARDLGLKVTPGGYDERKNYTKSTRAAALYLRDLYNELGDWLLVIAAYNTGTNNVYHAIHRAGSRSFWDLQNYLPAESRNHVKKFIGTQYVFEGQGSVTTLTRDEAIDQLSGSSMYVFHRNLSADELNSAQTASISGKYYSTVIAQSINMDEADFSRYNPDFDKVMASANNTYDLKLPADKMELFAANKYQILNESVQQLLNGETAQK